MIRGVVLFCKHHLRSKVSLKRNNILKHEQNPCDPGAILISFHRRMDRSVAGKNFGKQNMGQKTPINHNKARQSVLKKANK